MDQYKQLKLSVESTQIALNKLRLAITSVQNAMAELFSAITPEMMQQIAEPDKPDTQNEPNTVGITTLKGTDYIMDGAAIRTLAPKSIAQAIAAATKALEAMPEFKRKALDNGEFSQ